MLAAETRWPGNRPGSLERSTFTLLPAARHFSERDSLFVCKRTGDPAALGVERVLTASVVGSLIVTLCFGHGRYRGVT